MVWQQVYVPLGNMFISTALAAVPVVVMLAALGFFHIKAHIAATLGVLAGLAVAIFAYHMPAEMAGKGEMIDAQSIVVASAATRWFNHEGDVQRFVFFHSIALACLVGLLVTLQAYAWPFTLMVVR